MTNITRAKLTALRPGQALVEFAIIRFVLTAMLAGFLGIIVMGLGSFQNNIAAKNAGRVLDRNSVFTKANFVSVFASDPVPSFDDNSDLADLGANEVDRVLNVYAFDASEPDRRLYDECRLIISRSDWNNRSNLGLSAINESLLGQSIFDRDLDAYRFPGAVVTNGRTDKSTVLIPLLPETQDEDNDGSVTPHGIDRSFNVTSDDETEFDPVSNDWVAPVVIGKSRQSDGSQFRIIMFHPSQPASMVKQVDLSHSV